MAALVFGASYVDHDQTPAIIPLPMSDKQQLETLLLGVDVWNEWREKENELHPDLSGIAMPEAELANVNLAGANLRGADLHGAELSGADLSGTDLGNANLRGAILHGADLNWSYLGNSDLRGADLGDALLGDANLSEANLAEAYLGGADLHGADLRGVNLSSTDLSGANLTEAAVGYTRFGDIDLSTIKGLALVKHAAPSTIGIDTLYRSKGIIPEMFLRGAGVPENFINFIDSLPRKREPRFTCFISHHARDKRFCDRLYHDLQSYGVRAFYYPEDAPRGKRFLAELVVRVRMFDKVIAVCSKHSLCNAEFLDELDRAFKRERVDYQRVLFPIRLDNYLLKEWEHPLKTEVIGRVVADFRGWTRSLAKYESALKQLQNELSRAE
jgi:uncharacterized protein YjbI with pentapeptide repeats